VSARCDWSTGDYLRKGRHRPGLRLTSLGGLTKRPCAKKFLKAFCEETIVNDNGYPTYRRRDTGVTHRLKRGQSVFEVDNRWVVPYNPWLSLKYDSHINLEYCALIVCIKYIFK
jgi:hypothetical protein